jgi:hypothetical protein
LFLARDDTGDCEVVVKGTVAGQPRGWYRTGAGDFQSDRAAEAPLGDGALRALAASTDLTYSCVPSGSGYRIGVDRDMDGALDGDELDGGTDPADPVSGPPGAVNCLTSLTLDKAKVRLSKILNPAGDERIALGGFLQVPRTSAPIDPITYGFSFKILDSGGAEILSRIIPPGESFDREDPGWTANKAGTRWRFKDRSGATADGIIAAVVTDKGRRSPGLYQFRVTGKEADFQVDAADAPLQLVVVFGNGAQTAAGECGGIAFNPEVAERPNCKVPNNLKSVTCR